MHTTIDSEVLKRLYVKYLDTYIRMIRLLHSGLNQSTKAECWLLAEYIDCLDIVHFCRQWDNILYT